MSFLITLKLFVFHHVEFYVQGTISYLVFEREKSDFGFNSDYLRTYSTDFTLQVGMCETCDT